MDGVCVSFAHIQENPRKGWKMKLEKKKKIKKTDDKKNGKKWTKKRKIALGVIIAGILATVAFVVMIFVFDLGPVRPIESTEEEAKAVGTCAGFEVRYEELRYITHMHRASLDKKYGEYSSLSASDKAAYERELEELVKKDLENNYAVLSLCEKYGIDIESDKAREYVNDSIEEFVDEVGGKKAYKAWLKENKLSDSFLRLMYKVAYLEIEIVETLSERGEEIKYSEENVDDENNLDAFVKFVMEDESYVKVIHAYYPNDFKYSDGRDAKAHAEDTLAEIMSAEDDEERFTVMKSAIGSAPFVPGYSVTGTDYYITLGQMHKHYEDIAFTLAEYEVSQVLELEEGCYVIMRVPKIREEVAPRAYELVKHYKYAVVKNLIEKQKTLISFEENRYFATLTLAEID